MFSDTQFQRLLWKEYRQQRALWLALLIATPALELLLFLLLWWGNEFQNDFFREIKQNADMLMSGGFAAGVVYLLGCCGTMFAVEHETEAFRFQRLLPAGAGRVFWAKVGFAVVSAVALNTLLWLMTQGLLSLATATSSVSWFGRFGLLYMIEVTLWSVLASLLIRWPLWCVIAAISAQTLVLQWLLPRITGTAVDLFAVSNDQRYLAGRIGIVVALAVTNLVVGRLWFEERLRWPQWRWRWRSVSDRVADHLSAAELPAYIGQRQLGWWRLAGLAWRDIRWVIGAVLVLFVLCWRPSPTTDQWHRIMLVYFFGSFVFGLMTFAPEQWGGRFRFHVERGCWPRLVWLSRQVVCLPPVLFMMCGGLWLCIRNPQVFAPHIGQRTFEWAAATVGPLVCYAAGQLTTMLFRNAAIAFATGLGLTFCGILWSVLMSTLLIPAWWSIGSLPLIGLFVTWLKAKDWIEERRERAARWRTLLGLAVPGMSLLIAVATFRVVQIPAVALPLEWDSPRDVLARLTTEEKESLALYRQAVLGIEAAERRMETYAARTERMKREHTDWNEDQLLAAVFQEYRRELGEATSHILPLLHTAHAKPPVPISLITPDLPANPDSPDPDRVSRISMFIVDAARRSLKTGDLDDTWKQLEVGFEIQRRCNYRASPVRQVTLSYDDHLLQVLAEWGRHPGQTQSRIVMAIRYLEQRESQPDAAHRAVHWELLVAQGIWKTAPEWQQFNKTYGAGYDTANAHWILTADTKFAWFVRTAMPWEIWRSQRASRWQSSLALRRADVLTRLLKLNRALPLLSWDRDALSKNWQLPNSEWNELKSLGDWNYHSRDSAILGATILPTNMNLEPQSVAEQAVLYRSGRMRAASLQLAMADFHRVQGKFPASLNELQPTYFSKIPCDPYSGTEFVYVPQGVAEDVYSDWPGQQSATLLLRRDVPFLWSPGSVSNRSIRRLPDGQVEFIGDNANTIPPAKALQYGNFWPLIAEPEEGQ